MEIVVYLSAPTLILTKEMLKTSSEEYDDSDLFHLFKMTRNFRFILHNEWNKLLKEIMWMILLASPNCYY